ncbi:MAG: Mur ligase family protein [Dongiaceae bacterium]
MRITGFQYLSGPNVYEDSGGLVVVTELPQPAGPGRPLPVSPERCEPVFAALGLAELGRDWAGLRIGLGEVLCRVAGALLARCSIHPPPVRMLERAGTRLVAFLGCEHERVGLLAWDCACKALLACRPGEEASDDFRTALAAFERAARRLGADLNTLVLARAAARLDVPWYRLDVPGQFVQIGQGAHRRFLRHTTADSTGFVSRHMAQNKALTNRLLRAAGVPVLPMREVGSEAEAINAAESLGYPVVVRPCRGGGKAVGVNLAGAEAVAAAFRRVAAEHGTALVERFAAGEDHRVLVAGGRVVSVTRRNAAGDTAVDATAALHPENRRILERAAAVLQLGTVGIDFMIADVARPWQEAGGLVRALNALPDLPPQQLADPGSSAAEDIVRALLPPGGDGRIPTCGITGSLGKTTTANMVARILAVAGLQVGRCTTVGVSVGEERLRSGDCAGGVWARELLLNPLVEAGVFELARGGLLKDGMVIDDVEVGAVLNVRDNHIGMDGIADRGQLARIKGIVARRARRMLVLNAEDPLCLAMRDGARAGRLCLVARDAAAPALSDHLAAGGCGVFLRGAGEQAVIILCDGGRAEAVAAAAAIPATLGGLHEGKLWNAMFAAAIAHGLGMTPDRIRAGLAAFKTDFADAQGRSTIIERRGLRILLDHAFGFEALEEMARTAARLPVAGRRWLYIMRAGDVADDLVRETGRRLAGAFDRYVCTNSTMAPRPDPDAVPGLLREGLLAAGVAGRAIACIPSHEAAMRYILTQPAAGDLVAINTNMPERIIELLDGLDVASSAAGRDRDMA